jgi:hypothetical protein
MFIALFAVIYALQAMSLLFRLAIGFPTVPGFGFMRMATPSP